MKAAIARTAPTLQRTTEAVVIPHARQTDNNPRIVNPISIATANRRNSLASGRQLTCLKNGRAFIFTSCNNAGGVLDLRQRRSPIPAQGWSAATNLGLMQQHNSTLKGFGFKPNAFSVRHFLIVDPGLSLRSNPGLKLANAFGVIQRMLSNPTQTGRGVLSRRASPVVFLCATNDFPSRGHRCA